MKAVSLVLAIFVLAIPIAAQQDAPSEPVLTMVLDCKGRDAELCAALTKSGPLEFTCKGANRSPLCDDLRAMAASARQPSISLTLDCKGVDAQLCAELAKAGPLQFSCKDADRFALCDELDALNSRSGGTWNSTCIECEDPASDPQCCDYSEICDCAWLFFCDPVVKYKCGMCGHYTCDYVNRPQGGCWLQCVTCAAEYC